MIMEAEAEAEAIALKGDAEAYAIEIKAKVTSKKLQFFQSFPIFFYKNVGLSRFEDRIFGKSFSNLHSAT